MKGWMPLCVGLAFLAAQQGCGKPPQSHPSEKAVMDSSAKPFGLSPQEQAKVKITLAWPSRVAGAREKRIEIDGTGEIRTVQSANGNGPDQIVSGRVNPAEVAALLVFMESENVPGYDPEDSQSSSNAVRPRITLTLPSEERSGYGDSSVSYPQFQHIAGAMEFLAAEGARNADSPLPFGLRPSDMKGVRIFLSNAVKKSGYGKEQLEIEGTGKVTLYHSVNYEAPLKSLTGTVSQEQILVLLSYLNSNGFMEMKDGYVTPSRYEHVRYVRLTLPSGEKGVYAEDPSAPVEFIRIYGAVKFLAGIAVSECLDRKKYFFFYL